MTNRAIDSVRPYENNPRIVAGAVDAVARSLREFGWRQPIVVDTDGVIIVGHVRWLAAKKNGFTEVPVHVATELTADQVRAYRIADNRLGEIAEWDDRLLALELAGLAESEFDLGALGFDSAELEKILGATIHGNGGLADPDSIPVAPDTPITQRGDLWILGEHRLLCGDSSNATDIARLLGSERIQLVHTDPPYNVAAQPNATRSTRLRAATTRSRHQRGAVASPTKMRAKDRPIANDCVSEEKFRTLLRSWFSRIAEVLEPGRAFYIWGGYANVANYPAALKDAELYFSQSIIWVKEHAVIGLKDFMGNHEWCFYGWREGAAHYFTPEIKNAQDVWRLSRAAAGTCAVGRGVNVVAADGSRVGICPPNARFRDVAIGESGTVDCFGDAPTSDVWSVRKVSPQQMVHLTEKPVELAERAMLYSSRPGENVLDLFGGSGSTLIAAERMGRHARLVEIDPLYCDVIVKRFEEFTGKKAQRGG